MESSNRVYDLVKTYKRMYDVSEDEDDHNLVYFFMGCVYAASNAYEIVMMDEIEEEIKNER
jgi:hypothetical protein